MAQGVDEETTHLVAWVPHSEPGVLERGCTAAGQETGFGFLTSHSSILNKISWWDPPPSLHNLHHNKFLPPGGLRGS